MPNAADVRLAERLQQARESLHTTIEQAVRAFERDHAGPVELRLDLTNADAAGDIRESQRPLAETIRTLVHQFQQSPEVLQAGTRVVRVTAIDSDGDGTAAVDVKFAYADER